MNAARRLLVAGLAMQALLAAFILLFVNVPPGFDGWGLHLVAVQIFRSLWRYPSIDFSPHAFHVLAIIVIAGLWAIYLAASLWRARQQSAEQSRRQAMVIFAWAALFNAELVLVLPPVLSSDVFHYALFGRMFALYGLSPYSATGDAVAGADPFWSLAIWRHTTTHYGPTWTLLSALPAVLGRSSVLVTLILFKAMAAIANLAGAALVFQLARRLTHGNGVRALILYAWNPLLMIESAGTGHNDIVMMALALAGVWLVVRRHTVAGIAVLVVSALVKYLTLLLVFLVAAHALSHIGAREARRRFAVRMTMCSLAAALLLYLPFLVREGPQQLLGSFLHAVGLQPANTGPWNDPSNALPNQVEPKLRAAVDAVLPALGDPQVREAYIRRGVRLGLRFAFAVLLAATTWRITRFRADWPAVLAGFSFLAFVYSFIVFGGSFPRYLVPSLATVTPCPLTKSNVALLAVCIGFGIALMLRYSNLYPIAH